MHAWRPRPSAFVAGNDHLVTSVEIRLGRLYRKAGDALCKPRRKFWDLSPGHAPKANCSACLAIAQRLQSAAEHTEQQQPTVCK